MVLLIYCFEFIIKVGRHKMNLCETKKLRNFVKLLLNLKVMSPNDLIQVSIFITWNILDKPSGLTVLID